MMMRMRMIIMIIRTILSMRRIVMVFIRIVIAPLTGSMGNFRFSFQIQLEIQIEAPRSCSKDPTSVNAIVSL